MNAVELVELVAGLSDEAKVRAFWHSATVEQEMSRQKSREELLSGLRRHRGRVTIVEE